MLNKKLPFLEDQLETSVANDISNQILELCQRESARRQKGQISFYENLSIPAYQNSHKLELGMERINRIKGQINLELEAKLMFKERIVAEENYFQYTFNPFTMNQQPLPPKKAPLTERKQKNIFQGIQDIKERSKREVIEKRMKNIELSFHDRKSKKTLLQIKKLHNQSANNPFQEAQNSIERLHKSYMDFQFLDKIVRRKDEIQHFVDFTKKKINIFQFIKGKGQRQFLNCRQTLKKLNFCHDSIVPNSENKQAMTTFKHLSLISRKFIHEKHDQIMSQHRLHSASMVLKLGQLNFQDIMLASTGILEPQQLTNYINRNVEVNDTAEVGNQFYNNPNRNEPIFQQNQMHMQLLYEHHSNNTYLQQKLKKIPFREKEIKQMQLSKDIKQKLEQILKIELVLASNSINDKIIRQKTSNSKQQIMNQQMLNSKKEKNKLNKQQTSLYIDEKIRMSKLYKDRSQKIKNEFIQLTLKYLKKEERRIKPVTVRPQKIRFVESDNSQNKKAIDRNGSLTNSNKGKSSKKKSKSKQASTKKVSKVSRFMKF